MKKNNWNFHRFLFGRRPRRSAIRAVVLVLLAFIVFGYVLIPVRVTGESMWPTYRSGGFNLIYLLAYAGDREPQIGDIVAVRLAGRRVLYLKRVVAAPGDQVAFLDGVLLRNGQPQPESYVLSERQPWNLDPVKLERDHYFLVGDNRDTDQVGHTMGRVRRDRIVGRIVF